MASSVIKGLTVEIGGDTTKLGKALEDVEKKSRSLSGELGSINRLLRLDPSNTELLAQKQRVLAEAVANTRDRLDVLREAERQVQQQFERGEVAEEQVRALQREIIEATNRLQSYERAAEETQNAIDNLGSNSEDAAEDVEDLANQERRAGQEAGKLDDSLDPLGGALKLVAGAAVAAATALVGAVEMTQEYRTEMGKLDTAFTTSGHSSEAATETYKELQSILGDTGQAVEASNMLAKLATDEDDLRELTHALTGVYATFGASLPLEGLAEAAMETRNVAKVTGPFADAINWANDAGTDWNEVLKDNNKALEAFKAAVEEGEAVEDAYTAALEACSDEQERQQLITGTLTKVYGKAGEQYKKTNKAVIEANKANEEWMDTMADLGAEVQPLVTDFKKLGTTILKNAQDPLEDLADFISDEVIPALEGISTWVLNNGDTIKNFVITATAVLVAYKAATIAATVAQNGLKGAIMATTVAQKALQLAQAATPWGLVATAVAGVVTALVLYQESAKEATEKVDILTEEERELMEAASDTADAFRDQKAATEETMGGISSQMGHIQSLATELQGLADASGRVQEKDQARAEFIVNELNEALGTEYEMTDGIIQKYDELTGSINEVIQAKTANAMLEAANADYVAAIQAENDALQNLGLAEQDYLAQLAVKEEAQREYAEANADLQEKMAEAKTEADYMALMSDAQRVENLRANLSLEEETLAEKEAAYNEAAASYGEYSNTIMDYEEAQQAVLEGNYGRATEILQGKSGNFQTYADDVDQATRQVIDSLYKEAIDAGIEADRIKQNYINGVEGYTYGMVKEAEEGYEAALEEWANAKADAEGVGHDLGSGLSEGMEAERSSLMDKARSVVNSIIGAFREAADSHSPSRKMIAFGEDMGEGAAIGMEHKTKRLDTVAEDQVNRLLGTYADAGEVTGQSVFRAVQGKEFTRQTQTYQNLTNGTGEKLDKILEAIERGQVLTIDSKTLVGATIDKVDSALGKRRDLVARGAM